MDRPGRETACSPLRFLAQKYSEVDKNIFSGRPPPQETAINKTFRVKNERWQTSRFRAFDGKTVRRFLLKCNESKLFSNNEVFIFMRKEMRHFC